MKIHSARNHKKAMMLIALSSCLAAFNAYALDVSEKFKSLESKSEGRIGVFAINTKDGRVISYRADEIFPTGCTSKAIGVAAVLKKSMSESSLLSYRVKYSAKDLQEWSPVTKDHVTDGMTISELGAAAISLSDNTAMNLLLKHIGGVQGMTTFARSIGNPSFRQDHDWPAEAYSGGPNNLEDASTPKDMVESLHKLTVGTVLDRPHRDLFTTWLINTNTGPNRITAGIPSGWIIGNKTGTGGVYGSTNDIAIVWPPKHEPLLIGVYYTSDNKNAVKREDLVSSATKIIVEEFANSDQALKPNAK